MNRFILLGGAHIFQLVCSVLGTVLIFRSLMPADVGTVVSIVAINGVLVIPVASCFGKIYSSLLVETGDANTAASFYNTGLAAVGLVALLPMGLVALFFTDPVYTILAGVLALLACHKLNLRHAEYTECFERIATVRIVGGLMILGMKALSAWLVAPYLFAVSFVVEHAIYYFALPVRGTGGPRATVRALLYNLSMPHVQSVAKLLPTEFAASLSLKYPLLMFGALSMPEAAALYNAATRLPDAFNGLLQALFAGVRPRAYREATETDPAQFPIYTTAGFVRKGIWLVVAAAAVIPLAMPLLFGEFYRQAQLGAGIYMLLSPAIILGIVQEVWMITSKLFWLSALKLILGTLLSVIGATVLFMAFGFEGAIAGVAIGAMAQAIFLNLLFGRLQSAFQSQLYLLSGVVWPLTKREP